MLDSGTGAAAHNSLTPQSLRKFICLYFPNLLLLKCSSLLQCRCTAFAIKGKYQLTFPSHFAFIPSLEMKAKIFHPNKKHQCFKINN